MIHWNFRTTQKVQERWVRQATTHGSTSCVWRRHKSVRTTSTLLRTDSSWHVSSSRAMAGTTFLANFSFWKQILPRLMMQWARTRGETPVLWNCDNGCERPWLGGSEESWSDFIRESVTKTNSCSSRGRALTAECKSGLKPELKGNLPKATPHWIVWFIFFANSVFLQKSRDWRGERRGSNACVARQQRLLSSVTWALWLQGGLRSGRPHFSA